MFFQNKKGDIDVEGSRFKVLDANGALRIFFDLGDDGKIRNGTIIPDMPNGATSAGQFIHVDPNGKERLVELVKHGSEDNPQWDIVEIKNLDLDDLIEKILKAYVGRSDITDLKDRLKDFGYANLGKLFAQVATIKKGLGGTDSKGVDVDLFKTFVDDIKETSGKSGTLGELFDGDGGVKEGIASAWALAQSTPGGLPEFRKKTANLTALSEIVSDPNVLSNVPGGRNRIRDIIAQIKNQTGFSPDVQLANIKKFALRFGASPQPTGYDKVFDELRNPSITTQDGIAHATNAMSDIPAGRKVKSFDLTFEEQVQGNIARRFDVEYDIDPIGNVNLLRFTEYKSYSDASQIGIERFREYVNKSTSTKQFEYVFNGHKLTDEQAKAGMRSFLNSKASQIIPVMSDGLKAELEIFKDESTDLFPTSFTSSQIDDLVNAIVKTKK